MISEIRPAEKPAPRILWITQRYPPLPGGMAVSCARQTRGLRRTGLPLDVLAIVEAGQVVQLEEHAREGGSDFHVSREAPQGMVAQRLWRLAAERHARQPYDWIVGFGAARPGHLATTLAAWLHVPSLVQVRGNDFDQDWFDPRMSAYVQAAFGRADVIGAVAPEMVDRIRALYPGRDCRFLPNGIDVAQWQRLPHEARRGEEVRSHLAAEGRRVVGLFGEWKYKKRLPAWLAAVRAAGLNDRIALLIVGTLDDECRQLLDDPVLAPLNLRLDFSAREELPGLYAACDFLALPSLYEGMPNVVLEAMACGVVPLVSRAGALEVMVHDGETGFVFHAEDRQSMAESLCRALALEPGEYRAMSGRATAFVAEHFSIEKELAAILDIFRRGGGPSRCT